MSTISDKAVQTFLRTIHHVALHGGDVDMITEAIQAAKDIDQNWQDQATIIATYNLVKEIHEFLTMKQTIIKMIKDEEREQSMKACPGTECEGQVPDEEPDMGPPWLTNGLMSDADKVAASEAWWQAYRLETRDNYRGSR